MCCYNCPCWQVFNAIKKSYLTFVCPCACKFNAYVYTRLTCCYGWSFISISTLRASTMNILLLTINTHVNLIINHWVLHTWLSLMTVIMTVIWDGFLQEWWTPSLGCNWLQLWKLSHVGLAASVTLTEYLDKEFLNSDLFGGGGVPKSGRSRFQGPLTSDTNKGHFLEGICSPHFAWTSRHKSLDPPGQK